MNAEKLKNEAGKYIDKVRKELIGLSNKIHDNPETMFQEYKACRWLTSMLESHNFRIEKNVAGLETAFKAVYLSEKKSPRIAFLAEYDALPGVGHGCGHNLISTMSAGAAVGLSKIKNLHGSIIVLGTPAEEGGGGKITMIEKGIFNQIDAAMMVHPSTKNIVGRGALAVKELKIKFKGKSAHASAEPEKGINALDAVIQTFNNIDALRQHLTEDVRIHGIITKGGVKPNIVPDYSEALFYVRALDDKYLLKVLEKVKNCAKSAGIATGASVSFELGSGYKSKKLNPTLYSVFKKNFERFVSLDKPPEHGGLGSSDIGDLSWVVPAIHPYISISDRDIPLHSVEFARAAKSDKANKAIIIGAKSLAYTAIDLFTNPELMGKVKEDFRRK
ncbi:MAG: M20 family metallopeptidase [Candidatus Thermoplasmatota archaeon]|nr:M20 family metallopeptidase [Candidatus Thermoplasmatota archaeon]